MVKFIRTKLVSLHFDQSPAGENLAAEIACSNKFCQVVANDDSDSDEDKDKPKSKLPFAKIIHNAARNKLIDRLAGADNLKAPVRHMSSQRKILTEKEQLAELDDLLDSESHDSVSNSSDSSISSSSEEIDFSDL